MPLTKLVISPAAQDDIKGIYQYGCMHWGKKRAFQYVSQLKKQLWQLLEHPEIGLLRSELSPIMRSFSLEKHIIFYCIKKEQIEVVRLLHGRQDPMHQLSSGSQKI